LHLKRDAVDLLQTFLESSNNVSRSWR
jgi:hypothetical protein